MLLALNVISGHLDDATFMHLNLCIGNVDDIFREKQPNKAVNKSKLRNRCWISFSFLVSVRHIGWYCPIKILFICHLTPIFILEFSWITMSRFQRILHRVNKQFQCTITKGLRRCDKLEQARYSLLRWWKKQEKSAVREKPKNAL